MNLLDGRFINDLSQAALQHLMERVVKIIKCNMGDIIAILILAFLNSFPLQPINSQNGLTIIYQNTSHSSSYKYGFTESEFSHES